MLSKMARVLFLGLLPLMVGCPGPLEPGYNPNQPPDQNSLGFGYVGETATVAGQWGIRWGIDRSPAVTAPTRIRFLGVGTLLHPQTLAPLDLGQEYDGAGGVYRPPEEVSPEGAVVKVGCEVFSPFTKRWEKSPDYEIRVTRKTTPMEFFYGGADYYPQEATVKAGTVYRTSLFLRPFPLTDPQTRSTLVPPTGFTGDGGSYVFEPAIGSIGDHFICIYTAPSTVAAPMDVIIRSTAYDPYVQQTRTVDFTLHVVP